MSFAGAPALRFDAFAMLGLPKSGSSSAGQYIASAESRRQERSALRGLSSTWSVGAVCIASLLAVPSLTVLGSLSQPSADVWVHLWRTQLLELIANTLALLAGVGLGTFVV